MSLKTYHISAMLRGIFCLLFAFVMVATVSFANELSQSKAQSRVIVSNNQQSLSQSSLQQNQDQIQSQNLWPLIINQFAFANRWQNRPEVQRQIRWILRNRVLLNRWLSNSKYFLYYVFQQTQRYHLPGEFALLPMIESNYDPYAYSYAGATGLWQMMPGTGLSGNLLINWWYDGRADVLTSTAAAMSYLQARQNSFHNWLYSLASYNTGAGAVAHAIHRNKVSGKSTQFWSLSLARQTRDYVPRLIALAIIISHPARYGVQLPFVANKPYFSSVSINKQLSLLRIAQLADVDLQTIHILNSGYRRWATPPSSNSIVLLPTNSLAVFNKNYHRYQKHIPSINWIYHQARATETLASIAKNYNTTPLLLKRVNGLVGDKLIVNQGLLVPLHLNHIQVTSILSDSILTAHDVNIPQAHKIQHRLLAHEDLSSLADEYHVTEGQIRYWNHMQPSQQPQLGQDIVLWVIGVDQTQWQQSSKHKPIQSSAHNSLHSVLQRLDL